MTQSIYKNKFFLGALAVGAISAVSVYFISSSSSASSALKDHGSISTKSSGTVSPKFDAPSIVPIDPAVVALADTEKNMYLQIAFSVVVPDTDSAAKVKNAMPEIKDRSIKYLSTKRSTEIADIAGKEVMENELIAVLNQPLASLNNMTINAKRIFLTAFITQE